jgi:hypothetical protein
MLASQWHIALPGVEVSDLDAAVSAFLGRDEVIVERLTKDGRRHLDARAAVVSAVVSRAADDGPDAGRVILDMVVRQVTPTVRPDDVLAALRVVAGLALEAAPISVREAQGPLDDSGLVGDPLAPDRL